MSFTALRGSTRVVVAHLEFRRSLPVEPVPSPRYGDLVLLAAAVGDVPLRVVSSLAADPDRDGGRDGDEREDQDDAWTLDGRA